MRKSLNFFTFLAKDLSELNFKTDVGSATKLLEERHVPPIFKYGILLISPDGEELVAESPALPGGTEFIFGQSEWFQRAKLADQAVFSRPFKNRVTHEPSIVIAAPIKNEENKVVAVVAGILELNQTDLFKYLYSSVLEGGSDILVISPKDNLFVASSIPEMVLKPTPEPGRNRLHDMAMRGYRGVGVTVNAYGVEELAAITSIESTGWFVATRQKTTEAYLPVRQLTESMLMYLVLSAILGVLIITFVFITMLSPLKKAALSVKDMAQGNTPLKKLTIVHKDEVGDLIDGFNSLVDAIDGRTDALETANQKLAALSLTDELTGLGNRRHFNEKLEQEWIRASRTKQPLALGMIDIDFFKKYNDKYGHVLGDECLQEISKLLASIISRAGDLSARYGGEEFAFIAPATDEEGARDIAEKFQEALHSLTLPHVESEFGFVTASIGIAVRTPTKGEESICLIKIADEALYLAKEQGRNRVVQL
ncbi:conserved hypothetical signaling protein [Shewanella sediminis HAW-EB3]|uniref:diguanylate cyclase n=2 Tax=Shewanella sediminis TaxID=271097 RepID=A8FZK2_SHESH|nr:conserved hypothetical signaling protein [Shewanella sediminis HAW-EB3]